MLLWCRWSDVLLGLVPNPKTIQIPPFTAVPDDEAPIQNILVWLTDSISRDYYRHNLPRTWSFLESLLEARSGRGGFDFHGFNTMGLNSYPNYVPLFTGEAHLRFFTTPTLWAMFDFDNSDVWFFDEQHKAMVSTNGERWDGPRLRLTRTSCWRECTPKTMWAFTTKMSRTPSACQTFCGPLETKTPSPTSPLPTTMPKTTWKQGTQ